MHTTSGKFIWCFVRNVLRGSPIQRRWTWTGDFKCREVKTGFYRNRSMQTGSSGTLIGWKSGQTTFVPLWDRMEGTWLRSHAPSIRSHRGTKVVWSDFQPMRVPEEPVCIQLFRQNPVFTSLLLKSPVHVVPPQKILPCSPLCFKCLWRPRVVFVIVEGIF